MADRTGEGRANGACTPTFAALLLASVIGFLVLAALLVAKKTNDVDHSVVVWFANVRSSPLDAAMRAATFIGSSFVTLPVAGMVAILAWLRGHRRASVIVIVDVVAVACVSKLLKFEFGRDRPTIFSKIDLPSSYSFPSGHSMGAVAVWILLAVVLADLLPAWRRLIFVAGGLLVIAIGVSRVYLGVHWPADVVGAYLAGVPFLLVSLWFLRDGQVSPRRCAT